MARYSDRRKDLHKAVDMGNVGAVQDAIARGCDLDLEHPVKQLPPLHQAICEHKDDIVRVLVEAGASPLPINQHSWALCVAAKRGTPEAARIIAQAIGDIQGHENMMMEDAGTGGSLHRCAQDGVLRGIKTLVELGLDINAIDPKGNNALMYALSSPYPLGILEGMIQMGADPFQLARNGDNLLMRWAARESHEQFREVAVFLLEIGMDPLQANSNGIRAIDIAGPVLAQVIAQRENHNLHQATKPAPGTRPSRRI